MPVSTYSKEMRQAIDTIRVRFSGVAIRRTLRSVDYSGQRISGLEPFEEHFIKVSIYPREMENLESVAKSLIEDSTHKKAQGSVSPFASRLFHCEFWPFRTFI